jgi:hypothetical protein
LEKRWCRCFESWLTETHELFNFKFFSFFLGISRSPRPPSHLIPSPCHPFLRCSPSFTLLRESSGMQMSVISPFTLFLSCAPPRPAPPRVPKSGAPGSPAVCVIREGRAGGAGGLRGAGQGCRFRCPPAEQRLRG